MTGGRGEGLGVREETPSPARFRFRARRRESMRGRAGSSSSGVHPEMPKTLAKHLWARSPGGQQSDPDSPYLAEYWAREQGRIRMRKRVRARKRKRAGNTEA